MTATSTPHDGLSWTIVGRYPTFDLADAKRNEIAAASEIQVKVHYQGPENHPYYAVKTRENPDLAAAASKKAEKLRRKKKLSKKRRKK
jgi:hypothetical protein